jgi:hypothetical protein
MNLFGIPEVVGTLIFFVPVILGVLIAWGNLDGGP